MNPDTWKRRRRLILVGCLAGSAAIHALFVLYLSRSSSSVDTSSQPLLSHNEVLIDLNEVYSPNIATPAHGELTEELPTVQTPELSLANNTLKDPQASNKLFVSRKFAKELAKDSEIAFIKPPDIEIDQATIESLESLCLNKAASISSDAFDANQDLPVRFSFPPLIDYNAPKIEKDNPFFISSTPQPALRTLSVQPQSFKEDTLDDVIFFPIESVPANKAGEVPKKKPKLRDYGLNSELVNNCTYESSKAPVQAMCSEDMEKGGYYFSVKLTLPVQKQNTFPQNFYFVIDRASLMDRHRFGTYKKAVIKALKYIPEGQHFNIHIIGRKTTSMSKKNLVVNSKSISFAEAFLEKQQDKLPYFAQDISAQIEKIYWPEQDDATLNTIVVLTNGKTSANERKRWKSLDNFLQSHRSYRLYTAAVGGDNDLLFLDFLATKAGGRLVYSDTHSSFPRKLSKLVLNLNNPLVQDIRVICQPMQSDAKIELISPINTSPVYYYDEPYVIYGKVDQLTDFELQLEGVSKEGIISTVIPVKMTERSNEKVQKADLKLALKGAHANIDKFVAQGDKKSLKKARAAVDSLGVKAFE